MRRLYHSGTLYTPAEVDAALPPRLRQTHQGRFGLYVMLGLGGLALLSLLLFLHVHPTALALSGPPRPTSTWHAVSPSAPGSPVASQPPSAPSRVDTTDLLLGLLAVGIAVVYSLPSLIARYRQHPHRRSISVINVFLGWTLIGWVTALALAVMGLPDRPTARQDHVQDGDSMGR